jgi:hypothetical protein
VATSRAQVGLGPDSQSRPVACISSSMKSPKKKPNGAKLRSWRVAMRSRAHNLGTIEAPDAKAAEAEAVKVFGLTKKQRKRLLILKRG